MSNCKHHFESRCVDPGIKECPWCRIEELQFQLEYAHDCCKSLAEQRNEAERKLNKILQLVEEGLNEL